MAGKTTIVVHSGEMDKVLSAFIIANGSLSMGMEVSLYFTFWGLNILRKPEGAPVQKNLDVRL